jgi:hypothetical protein
MADQLVPAPPALRKDAIGLREVPFQSITDMAPGAAIAASIPTGAAFAGGSLPLSVVFALIACLLCAVCVGELAKHMPAAPQRVADVSRVHLDEEPGGVEAGQPA